MRRTRFILIIVVLCLARTSSSAQSTIFVDHLAQSNLANGLSWQSAYSNLQDALAAVQPGDEIWMSEGIYTPDIGTGVSKGDRAALFNIPDGITIYGGFSAQELSLAERDLDNHETILSGDLDQNDQGQIELENPSRFENSYGLVLLELIFDQVILDGLTISAAHGNDRDFAKQALRYINSTGVLVLRNVGFKENVTIGSTIVLGGFCSCDGFDTVLENVTIENNYGGQVGGINSSVGNVKLFRTSIISNRSNNFSAIRKFHGEIVIIESEISNNVSTGSHTIWIDDEGSGYLGIWSSRIIGNRVEGSSHGGGAITLSESHLQSVNNIYSGNQTATDGGAILLADFTAEIVNDLFAFNHASDGGGAISTRDIQVTLISNSIFYKNTSADGTTLEIKGQNSIEFVNSIIDTGGGDGAIGTHIPIVGTPIFRNDVGPDQIGGTRDDDFRIDVGSITIDRGRLEALPTDRFDLDGDGDTDEVVPFDIDGRWRIYSASGSDGAVDIGPYEFGSSATNTNPDVFDELPMPNTRESVHIYPIPAHHIVTITVAEKAGFIRFTLFDSLGKSHGVVFEGMMLPGESFKLDVSKHARGIYYLVDQARGLFGSLIVL